MIEGLLDGLAGLDTHWFLLLAFFLPFGETVALLDAIVPGEVGMVLLGAAASDAGVPIPLVIAIGALGAFAGDSTSWFIGHRWGYRLITKWEPIHRRMAKPLEAAERHFEAKACRQRLHHAGGVPPVATGAFPIPRRTRHRSDCGEREVLGLMAEPPAGVSRSGEGATAGIGMCGPEWVTKQPRGLPPYSASALPLLSLPSP